MTTNHDQITRLAPTPEALDSEWSRDTLATILAARPESPRPARPWWRRTRRRAAALVAVGVVTMSAGTAVAMGGPSGAIKNILLDFSKQPNSTGNGLGRLDAPALVAKFPTSNGIYAVWIATSSRGLVCWADADGTWDGQGVPTKSELDYGCGGVIVRRDDPDKFTRLTRPDLLGGFFKDPPDGPLIYSVSPYPDAVRVRVRGTGVDRTLPVRGDSHGFGAALPEASRAKAVTVTFLDGTGRRLGSERWIAPVG